MSSTALPMRAANVDNHRFRRACGRFATGIAVATVMDPAGMPHGLTVNSFTSVSLNPPLVLICIGHNSNVIEHFRNSGGFGINVLSESQQQLSELFARKGCDRFEGVPWTLGEAGQPLIPDVLATIECSRYQLFTSGDHDIVVGEVVRANWSDEGHPLVYFGGGYRRLEA